MPAPANDKPSDAHSEEIWIALIGAAATVALAQVQVSAAQP